METSDKVTREIAWKKHVRLCLWAFFMGLFGGIAALLYVSYVARTEAEALPVFAIALLCFLMMCVSSLALLGPWLMRWSQKRIHEKHNQKNSP